jgi:uncharacterized membrane protein
MTFSLADFIQKKSLKLFARVRMYVQVTHVHALVRGLQNGTQRCWCAVRNELSCNFFCFMLQLATTAEEKMNRWVQKLTILRRRKLETDH